MRNTILPGIFLVMILSRVSLIAQNDFGPDKYAPIPLQPYSPPKDVAYKDCKLISFDMITNTFDTFEIVNKAYQNKKTFWSSGMGMTTQPIINTNDQGFDFTNLQPADQLTEFPDYPISAIVKLYLTFFNPVNHQNSFGTCSGVIIHPGFILTGAHCVKSKFDSSYVVSCTVVPAYNLGNMPYGLTTTTNWYALTQWTENGDLDYDVAMMRLADPLGDSTGWIGLGYNPDNDFFTNPDSIFYNFGYPGYDPLGNPVFEEGERMYYMKGHMDFWLTSNRMCHNNIGYGGTSGSGLIYDDPVKGRHVYGVLSHGSLFPPYHTCHSRIDSTIYYNFSTIIDDISSVEIQDAPAQLTVYPNPSNGIFNVDFSKIDFNIIQFDVMDVLGQNLLHETILPTNSVIIFNLRQYPAGTYFTRAVVDGKTITGRIHILD